MMPSPRAGVGREAVMDCAHPGLRDGDGGPGAIEAERITAWSIRSRQIYNVRSLSLIEAGGFAVSFQKFPDTPAKIPSSRTAKLSSKAPKDEVLQGFWRLIESGICRIRC